MRVSFTQVSHNVDDWCHEVEQLNHCVGGDRLFLTVFTQVTIQVTIQVTFSSKSFKSETDILQMSFPHLKIEKEPKCTEI